MDLAGRANKVDLPSISEARVAVVHEWLGPYSGSEDVVVEILRTFPGTDLFATVHDPDEMSGTPLEGVPVHTSFVQSLPGAKKRYRTYLPIMPLAVEQFDLRDYDLVISSSHAVAKGVLTRADQLHVSYVHTPMRYAWDLYLDYLEESGMSRGMKGVAARLALHYLRLWDHAASDRVDAFLANSRYVARRIGKAYRRPARVVYPPVDVKRYRADLPREAFYVAVSRMVPYKRMPMISEAFTRMEKPLVMIGGGPDLERVRRTAGPYVKVLGHQPDEVVADYLQRARAFVFAAEEDFGIAPIEAQAAGCPVIAFGKGGVLETVIPYPEPGATGLFFDEPTPEALISAVERFEELDGGLSPAACHRNAERFGRERFSREFEAALEELWGRFRRGENLE
ncbi:MAG: glycosyltransferase [Rubrobacter sp.]|nr:glycosyltransferase [Rubrobacter sp.]